MQNNVVDNERASRVYLLPPARPTTFNREAGISYASIVREIVNDDNLLPAALSGLVQSGYRWSNHSLKLYALQ